MKLGKGEIIAIFDLSEIFFTTIVDGDLHNSELQELEGHCLGPRPITSDWLNLQSWNLVRIFHEKQKNTKNEFTLVTRWPSQKVKKII